MFKELTGKKIILYNHIDRHKYFKRPIIPVLQTVPPEV
jgi:hypothetical protein